MTSDPGRHGRIGSRRASGSLLLLFALVLAGCSSSPSAPRATSKHHATTTTTTTTAPATTTTVAGATGPPCTGSVLHGSEAAFGAAAPSDQAAAVVVVLTNRSKAACSLSGYPSLQLLDAKGNHLPTTVQHGGSGIPSSLTVQAANLTAKGGQASFMLYWLPTPSSSEPDCPLAPKMTVSVPGSSTAISMSAVINACGGIIQSSPFQPGVIRLP